MPVYEIDEIEPGTTTIELSSLRFELTEEVRDSLQDHVSETYSQFLKQNNFEILINSRKIFPIEFDKWAYPPAYEPRYYMLEMQTESFIGENSRHKPT